MYNYFADLQLFTDFVNGITELYKNFFLYGIPYDKILDPPLVHRDAVPALLAEGCACLLSRCLEKCIHYSHSLLTFTAIQKAAAPNVVAYMQHL